jgi:hypothetical protein
MPMVLSPDLPGMHGTLGEGRGEGFGTDDAEVGGGGKDVSCR